MGFYKLLLVYTDLDTLHMLTLDYISYQPVTTVRIIENIIYLLLFSSTFINRIVTVSHIRNIFSVSKVFGFDSKLFQLSMPGGNKAPSSANRDYETVYFDSDILWIDTLRYVCFNDCSHRVSNVEHLNSDRPGHESAAVLLPGFAISW